MSESHYQESKLMFRRSPAIPNDHNVQTRGLVVYQYGGTMEECVQAARKEFHLGSSWKVVKWDVS